MCGQSEQQRLLDELWVKAVERIGPENFIIPPPGWQPPPITVDDFATY